MFRITNATEHHSSTNNLHSIILELSYLESASCCQQRYHILFIVYFEVAVCIGSSCRAEKHTSRLFQFCHPFLSRRFWRPFFLGLKQFFQIAIYQEIYSNHNPDSKANPSHSFMNRSIDGTLFIVYFF